MPIKKRPLLFGQILLILLLFWIALFFAWQTLSAVHFFYPIIYDALDIGAVIQQYGPLNVYKSDFEQTARAQHIQLFSEIVNAINQSGQGLAQIVYYDRHGQEVDTLLRVPEVVHLQDVANLLDSLRTASYWIILAWLLGVLFFKVKQWLLERIGYSILWVLGGLIGVATVVVLYDAQAIFYALHTMVFPEGNQWFFYYQESLMTTLMKAPDIFAVMAALLVSVAFFYFVLMLWLMNKYLGLERRVEQ
ncbi:hypothetical protein MNBD_GAMMA04-283 [hydrothermal vent metagenome]|uniref:Integral membrane protein n=1 Tax=hydrothermal vent metagenome TaxID=652676 RepID=A0A3B0VRK5_9ZZZZ